MCSSYSPKAKLAIGKIRPRMEAIASELDQPDAKIALLRGEVKKLGKGVDLIFEETINSKHIGAHSENRYGDGLIPANVHSLISKIFGHGYSFKSLQDPTCSQMPPPDYPHTQRLVAFNSKTVEDSAGLTPPYAEVLRAVSLTCGHTSQGLRCVTAGVKLCEGDPRFTRDGFLSLDAMDHAQPEHARAAKEGICWDVARWEFEDAFPWLPLLFQEVGNAGQAIAKPASKSCSRFGKSPAELMAATLSMMIHGSASSARPFGLAASSSKRSPLLSSM